jgi:hypothetical protein
MIFQLIVLLISSLPLGCTPLVLVIMHAAGQRAPLMAMSLLPWLLLLVVGASSLMTAEALPLSLTPARTTLSAVLDT